MPKLSVHINDFSGGLVDATNARDIPENALSDAKNISFTERSSIKTLGGGVTHTRLVATDFSGATGGDGSSGVSAIEGHLAGGYGLFAFESDYDIGLVAPGNVNASGATDQGSKGIMYLDCLNGNIHWYDYNTRTLNLRDGNNGRSCTPDSGSSVNHHDFSANKLAFTAAGASGVGDVITDDDSSFIGKFKAGDYIRIENCDDESNANNFQCLRIRDVNRAKITLDHRNFVTTDANESGSPKLHVLVRPVFYYAENAVRISDASFWEEKSHSDPTNANAYQNIWYGYIKRTHFQQPDGSTILSTANNGTFEGWNIKRNDLAAPTEFTVSTSSAYPSSGGTGLHLRLIGDSALATSGWKNTAYQCAASFIYDGNQESLLYIPTSNNTFTPSADNRKLNLEVDLKAPYNSRITGIRIYARLDETNDPWTLLLDCDLSLGTRSTLSDPYLLWDNTGHATQIFSDASLWSADINLETYEILNGFSADEKKISISGNGEGYRTAIIANRRAFIANMRTENEEGTVTQMRDRIMYSPPGKFDTFPRSYFIDAVKGDAGEYIKLEALGDRLLAYKQEKLFIINIGAPNPANWFLEEIKDFSGCLHPAAVAKADFGVMWANQYGFWLYDGQSIRNLIDGKLSEATWQSFYTNGTIVGYNPKYKYAVILSDCITGATGAGTDPEVFVYDFRVNAWSKAPNSAFASSSNGHVVSNMIVDHDYNLTFGEQRARISNDVNNTGDPDETITMIEWSETDKGGGSAGDSQFITKDITFGAPAKVKRFYSVIVTYKSEASVTTPISYSVNGGDSYANLTGNMANTSGSWDTLVATPSVPFEGGSLKIKCSGWAPGNGVEINDISIEYRVLIKNVS